MPKRSNKIISVFGADCPLDHLMKSSKIYSSDSLLKGKAATSIYSSSFNGIVRCVAYYFKLALLP